MNFRQVVLVTLSLCLTNLITESFPEFVGIEGPESSPSSEAEGEEHNSAEEDTSDKDYESSEEENEEYIEYINEEEIEEVVDRLTTIYNLGYWNQPFLTNPIISHYQQMDALFEQLRSPDTGLKRRDIGAFNKIKDCFKGKYIAPALSTFFVLLLLTNRDSF